MTGALKMLALVAVTLLFLTCGGQDDASPGAPGVGDPLYPGLGNGGYDVDHYALTIDVDVGRNFISGKVMIEAIATQDLSSFNLDLRGLEIIETFVSGVSATHVRRGNELTVVPGEPIESGTHFTVEVAYEGHPTVDEIPGVGYEAGWIRYPTGIYAVGEPWGSSTWFPVNEHPSDKASYTFVLTVPEPYEVAAIGELVSIVDNGATRTYTWEARDELASYLTAIAISQFDEVITEGPGGVPIVDLIEETVGEPARLVLRKVPDMLRCKRRSNNGPCRRVMA